jgi:hypothetical protein
MGRAMIPRGCAVQDPYTNTTNWAKIIGVVALVLGILALAAGIIYLTLPAHSLPALLGRLPNISAHRSKRGIAALLAGAILVIVGIVALARSRRAA